MDRPLDDIAFLANSENRVDVFETVVEAPRGHHEVREEVDASRVTVARILRELESRNWIKDTGQAYRGTPLGEWICDEFTGLRNELKAERRLRKAVEWLPLDFVTFDIRCLRDAEIILLEGTDTSAVIREIIEFHRSGDTVRGIARDSAPEFIENHWELTVHGDTEVDLVLTPSIIESIRAHPPTSRYLKEMLENEDANAKYHVYDDIPLSVGIVNGSVGMNLIDEDGTPKGGLKTDNQTVHEWAVELFESYREKATPVDPDQFTGD